MCKSKKEEHKRYIQSLPPDRPHIMQRSKEVFLLVIPPGSVEGDEPFPFDSEGEEEVMISIDGGEVRISRRPE